MKRYLLLLFLLGGASFGEPMLVYDPPSVAKFEVYFLGGRAEGRDYHLRAGFDLRAGYPFLVGAFYAREKVREAGNGGEMLGVRVKARVPLFWKFKNDISAGGMFDRKNGGFHIEMEQIVFLKRSFSLRIAEGYVFGNREVRRWVLSAGFGF